MSSGEIIRILVGDDGRRMLVYQDGSLGPLSVDDLIEKAFPRVTLALDLSERALGKGVPTTICRNGNLGQFEPWLKVFQEEYDWGDNTFVALEVVREGGVRYAKPRILHLYPR